MSGSMVDTFIGKTKIADYGPHATFDDAAVQAGRLGLKLEGKYFVSKKKIAFIATYSGGEFKLHVYKR